MKRLPLVFLLLCAAAVARGEDNPDFPQVHPAPNPGADRRVGTDPSGYEPIQPQPNQPPTGSVDNGNHIGDGNSGKGDWPAATAAGVRAGPSGPVIHNNIAPGQSDNSVSPDPAPGPMSLDDVRGNFATVVETYVSKKSPKGYWPYAEKVPGKKPKAWRLTRPQVDEDSVKKLTTDHYSGRVTLRDARGGRPPALEFVVDFSGVDWKVLSVKPAPPVR
ncbi:MAG: hypothetical protein ACHQ51_05180 [Elusimicrobiota bacterium]